MLKLAYKGIPQDQPAMDRYLRVYGIQHARPRYQAQMAKLLRNGRARLNYEDLILPNGLDSMARHYGPGQ